MLLGPQRRHMRGTIFGTVGLANSIRPLFRQCARLAFSLPTDVEQPVTGICVKFTPSRELYELPCLLAIVAIQKMGISLVPRQGTLYPVCSISRRK